MDKFKLGWWYYWSVVLLPWPAIVGFTIALLVSDLFADLLIYIVKWAWKGGTGG
jgi:hypothetical protein